MSLPQLTIDHTLFLDKSALLIGESGSGKSCVIMDILYTLAKHVHQCIVFSPTDRQNHTYEGTVPSPLIHYDVNPTILETIWERQLALSAIYTKYATTNALQRLFDKAPTRNKYIPYIESINAKFTRCSDDIGDNEGATGQIDDMRKTRDSFLDMIYRRCIDENVDSLRNMRLSADEQGTLRHYNLNPRLIIIFDDCTDLLKRYKSHPVVQKLFYQGRHQFITIILGLHTDKALDAELKKNAYVTIFTQPESARAHIMRPSTSFDKQKITSSLAACDQAFTPTQKYQKLVWIRDKGAYYRYTATKHEPFRVCCELIWNLLDAVKTTNGSIPINNKFIRDFM